VRFRVAQQHRLSNAQKAFTMKPGGAKSLRDWVTETVRSSSNGQVVQFEVVHLQHFYACGLALFAHGASLRGHAVLYVR
jgi:hypothetical protein